MKTYKFRLMARVYQDVEVEAESMDDACNKFMDEYGEVLDPTDTKTDGFPQAFCLNPDKMDGCNMYDVTVTVQAEGRLKVSAENATSAIKKAKAFHELLGFTKGFYSEFADDTISIKAVNEDDKTDRREMALQEDE